MNRYFSLSIEARCRADANATSVNVFEGNIAPVRVQWEKEKEENLLRKEYETTKILKFRGICTFVLKVFLTTFVFITPDN